ncbi:unnamed protein product [Prunus armeniaca]
MKDIWEAHKLNPPYLYKAQLQFKAQGCRRQKKKFKDHKSQTSKSRLQKKPLQNGKRHAEPNGGSQKLVLTKTLLPKTTYFQRPPKLLNPQFAEHNKTSRNFQSTHLAER